MEDIKELTKEHSKLKSKLDKVMDGKNTASPLDSAINRALSSIVEQQDPKGFWCYELETDVTIPSEYIMMMHYLGDIDKKIQGKLANYIRKKQQGDGGWPLYPGGMTNISCTVKAYYALILAGDDI